MSELFPGFEEFEADQQQQSEQGYDERMLKRMLSKLGDDNSVIATAREAGDEFGFEWFNGTYNPPIVITAVKLKNIKLSDLLVKSIMRKPIGEAFLSARAECVPELAVGVVFPIKNSSNWIIHDGDVSIIAGVSAVIRKGHDDSKLTIIPFDAFSEGLKQRWEP